MKQRADFVKEKISTPFYFFVLAVVLIFVAEALVMFFLSTLPDFSLYKEALLDSLFLSIVIVPMLYLLLFRPMVLHIKERNLAEKMLKEAHGTLEMQVEERTKELTLEIAERKRTEEALVKSQSLHEEAQRLAHIGHWTLDLARNELAWSDETYRIFEIEPTEFGASYDAFIDTIYPDDRELISTAYSNSLKNREPYDVIHRLQMKDGTIKYVNERCETFYNEDGKPLNSVGTVQDITERKMATDALEVKEKKYRMLHKNAFDGIVIADSNGVIIESNTSIEKIFGYEEDELVGENLTVLVPEEYLEAHTEGFNRFIHTGKGHVLEKVLQVEGKSKSGNVFPIELVLSQITIDGSLLLSGTIRDISERKKSEETIEKLAYYDQLTGLPNRALFMDRLNQSLARTRRYDKQLGLLFLDFDRFKNLNDTLGHVVGDKFLMAAAERLKEFTRSSDSVARLGGDEFVVFAADQEDVSGIMVVAGKISSIFKEPFEIDGHEFFMTASIGVSTYPQDGEDVTTLMKNADTAMYKAKAEGGGGYSHYMPSMNAMAMERLELENKLRRAQDREEFYLDYQPQVDSWSGEVVGVEALLRWRNADKGLISPAEFIPVAETTRLIVPIGEWVLREACEEMVRLHEGGLPGLNIAVNISLYQLKDKTFMDTLSKVLEETGLDPKYLELEITESVAMDNVAESIKMLNELKSKGISLSIDDFGTGYSSLEYLKRMPIDVLKIDRSFIINITDDHDDKKIVEMIVKIAHGFNCTVVAEGVETHEQLKVLRSFGCDIIQGYLFSRPVAPKELKGVYDGAAPPPISSGISKVSRG